MYDICYLQQSFKRLKIFQRLKLPHLHLPAFFSRKSPLSLFLLQDAEEIGPLLILPLSHCPFAPVLFCYSWGPTQGAHHTHPNIDRSFWNGLPFEVICVPKLVQRPVDNGSLIGHDFDVVCVADRTGRNCTKHQEYNWGCSGSVASGQKWRLCYV